MVSAKEREEGDQTRQQSLKLDWNTPDVLHFQRLQPLNTFSYKSSHTLPYISMPRQLDLISVYIILGWR